MQDLISIIMPVKNTSAYLEACLNSVLQQSEPNWELIAVDDHSTDDSKAILHKYAANDARIKVLENTAKGIIPALQLAYNKSSGEFITRMDSDDIMVPEKLATQKQQLLQHGNNHIALGLVKYFSDNEMGEGYLKYENWLNELTKNGSNFSDIYKECVIASPCWMVYKTDFEKCGGFDSNIYPEDYDLTFRFYKNGLKCLPSNQLLHLWRDYPERTSRNHEHYAYNSFIELKVHHFLNIDYRINKKLLVWGAGRKGKKVAELLQQSNIPFTWICDNPKKIGKEIYGQQMIAYNTITDFSLYQSIITIANPKAQQEVKALFAQQHLLLGKNFFFFC